MDKTVKFKVEIESQGQKVLHNISMEADGLRKLIGQIPDEAEKAGKSLSGMANFALALNSSIEIVERLGSVIGGLADDFNTFDKSMRAVNTMAGENADGLAALTGQVEELANTIPLAKDQLAGGLYQTISNGVPKDNWIAFLEKSSKAAVGGMADLGQTVTVTSTLIKNYGLEWSAAGEIQDKIQMTAKNGVTSFEQMAQALPRVAGNAATLGVSVDELMGTFATLTGVSGNTAEVSTQLAAVFTALVKPTSEATEMAEAMGVQFDAAAIKAAGGMQNFLTNLDSTVQSYAAANGMLAQEIYGKLFGSAEALRALIPLNGELAEKFTENVDAMAGAAGTIDGAFEQMKGSGDSVTQLLKNQLSTMMSWAGQMAASAQPYLTFIALGGQAVAGLATLGQMLSTATAAVKAFTIAKWAEIKALVVSTAAAVKNTAATVLSSGANIRLTAAIIATAVAQKAVAVASNIWTVAQWALNAALTANPVGVVIMAIAALVAAVVLAYKNSETFRNICDQVWKVIKGLAGVLLEGLVQALKVVVEKLKIAWDWLSKLLGLDGGEVKIKAETPEKSGQGAKPSTKPTGKSGQPPKRDWRTLNYTQLGEAIEKQERKMKSLIGVNDAAARSEKRLLDQMKKRYTQMGKQYGLESGSGKSGGKKPAVGLIGKTEEALTKAKQAVTDAKSESGIAAAAAKVAKLEARLERLKKLGEQPTPINVKAATLDEIEKNITALQTKLKTATYEQAACINQDIAYWQKEADAIKQNGTTTAKGLNEKAETLRDIGTNIELLREKLQTAGLEEAAQINKAIAIWEKKSKTIQNAGKDLTVNASAKTLREISANVDVLTEKLQDASVEQAAQINKEIDLWKQKSDAIRNAGKAGESTAKQLLTGWGNVKSIAGSIDSITEAVEGNGSAWKKLTAVVDGVIGILQTAQAMTALLTAATTAQTAATTAGTIAKEGHAAAAGTDASASAASAGASLVAATASGTEAAADTTAAVAKTMKAHAWIPFVGVAIGGALVGALIASVASAKNSVPKFANGGIAYGPTLGLFGEYAGASHNPEVVAPLDKLRTLLDLGSGGQMSGKVKFEIEGRKLVGVLRGEEHRSRRNL